MYSGFSTRLNNSFRERKILFTLQRFFYQKLVYV